MTTIELSEYVIDAIADAVVKKMQQPCDDAINREAVKEIINDIRDCISVEGYCAILERLKKLPSVTQKSETVTEFADRCRECGAKYGKLLEQKSGKWIPFSERLPKPFEHCLITTTDGKVIYHYDDGNYSKYKAWMPLPKPYEPQESEVNNG